ncbi:MAG: Thymidine kinase [Legionellaceae bacterium]
MAKLHFYFSAMNAGKSTVLLQSAYNYEERGMKTILFTPAIDTRYSLGKITSRIGLQADAIPFDSEFNLFEYVSKVLSVPDHKIKCIFIDEAQFLNKQQVSQLTEIVDLFNLPVLAYGLRVDYMGEPFEGSKYLLAWAEEINEIKTICHCGSKATMNLRIDAEGNSVKQGEQIVIGGNESYIATCRKHYKKGERYIEKK